MMQVPMKYLTDENGNKFSPVTGIESVYWGGTSLANQMIPDYGMLCIFGSNTTINLSGDFKHKSVAFNEYHGNPNNRYIYNRRRWTHFKNTDI